MVFHLYLHSDVIVTNGFFFGISKNCYRFIVQIFSVVVIHNIDLHNIMYNIQMKICIEKHNINFNNYLLQYAPRK